MSEGHISESLEVITKEIVLELIKKSSLQNDKLADYACESYAKVCKQVYETYNNRK